MIRLPAAAWQRNHWVMVATTFVVFTGFAFVLPFLPLYVRQLGVADEERAALWAGVLIGVAPLLAGLLAPVWGRLADRYGQKRMALRALGSSAVLLALGAAVTGVGQLLALRIGVGLFGGVGPLALAMATSLAPREQTGKVVGQVQAAQILSAAFGPLAGGLLADTIGMRATFVAAAVLCGGAFLVVAAAYQEAPAASSSALQPRGSFGEVLRLPGVPALLVVLFLVNFIGRSFTPILPLHLASLGVRPQGLASATGLLIGAYAVAAATSAAALGRASRRFAPRSLLAAGLAAGALTVLPMAVVQGFPALLWLAVLLGLVSGGCLTLCYTMGGLMVPGDRRATAFGFFAGAALFGGSVSPSVAGLLAHWTLRGIYYVDAALFVLLAVAQLAWLAPLAGKRSVEASPPGVGDVRETAARERP
jgi:MFS transporter, DHA1 family, multidrug resistance protein